MASIKRDFTSEAQLQKFERLSSLHHKLTIEVCAIKVWSVNKYKDSIPVWNADYPICDK